MAIQFTAARRDSVRTTGLNQDGVEVITFRRAALICRLGRSPEAGCPRRS